MPTEQEEKKLWKKALHFATGMVGAGAVQSIFDLFLKSAGDTAAPKAMEWIADRVFGPNTSDERRFEEALNMVPPNWASRLTARLAVLKPHQSDYYRITIMNDKVAEIAKTQERHARMEDDDWSNHLHVMNIHLHEAETQLGLFKVWMTGKVGGLNGALQAVGTEIGADIEASGVNDTADIVITAQREQIGDLVGELFRRR